MDNFEFDELDEELVTDTGHSTSGEGLAKIRSLAAAVASSDKYQEDTNSFSRKSLKPEASSSAVGGKEAGGQEESVANSLSEIQRVEDVLDDCHFKDAVAKLSSSASSATKSKSFLEHTSADDLSGHLRAVSEIYNSSIGPEEEAQEALISIASFPDPAVATVARPAHASDQLSLQAAQKAQVQRWATELFQTSEAIHVHEDDFFPPWLEMGKNQIREISLIQFIDENTAATDDGEEANIDGGDEEEEEPCSYMQFVFWDDPRPPHMIGRRLRLESGRFVWKPPARIMANDNLGGFFQQGSARVILVPRQ